MQAINTDLIKYPIGKFVYNPEVNEELREKRMAEIATLPLRLEIVAGNLTTVQLNQPYRQGGWTVRQLIHHIADSHMNAFIRFKLALTEDMPVIKPYNQDNWVEGEDVIFGDITDSIQIIKGLHARWFTLMRSLKQEDWNSKMYHPEYKREMDLNYLLALYSWHGNHHVAQIANCEKGQ